MDNIFNEVMGNNFISTSGTLYHYISSTKFTDLHIATIDNMNKNIFKFRVRVTFLLDKVPLAVYKKRFIKLCGNMHFSYHDQYVSIECNAKVDALVQRLTKIITYLEYQFGFTFINSKIWDSKLNIPTTFEERYKADYININNMNFVNMVEFDKNCSPEFESGDKILVVGYPFMTTKDSYMTTLLYVESSVYIDGLWQYEMCGDSYLKGALKLIQPKNGEITMPF